MRKFTIGRIERIFSNFPPPTPELFKDAMNSLLVDYNGFLSKSINYYVFIDQKMKENYEPFTNIKIPKSSGPLKDIKCVEFVYNNFASQGIVPKDISIRMDHNRGSDRVTTLIRHKNIYNFKNNCRLPSINDYVSVISTTSFGFNDQISTMKAKKMFEEEAKKKNRRPESLALEKGHICIPSSNRYWMHPSKILEATKNEMQTISHRI